MKVLFAGRLDPFKDPVTFVQAAKRLSKHTFILAGEGQLYRECRKEADGLKNIFFYPWLSKNRLHNLRTNCDVFCQLSPVENIWAGSLIEAMKQKIAVVCTDVGYTKHFLEDGFHVLLVPPRDPWAVARAIKRLEDKPLRVFLEENAYNYVVQNLSISKIAAQIIGVAKNVC